MRQRRLATDSQPWRRAGRWCPSTRPVRCWRRCADSRRPSAGCRPPVSQVPAPNSRCDRGPPILGRKHVRLYWWGSPSAYFTKSPLTSKICKPSASRPGLPAPSLRSTASQGSRTSWEAEKRLHQRPCFHVDQDVGVTDEQPHPMFPAGALCGNASSGCPVVRQPCPQKRICSANARVHQLIEVVVALSATDHPARLCASPSQKTA